MVNEYGLTISFQIWPSEWSQKEHYCQYFINFIEYHVGVWLHKCSKAFDDPTLGRKWANILLVISTEYNFELSHFIWWSIEFHITLFENFRRCLRWVCGVLLMALISKWTRLRASGKFAISSLRPVMYAWPVIRKNAKIE